MEKRKLGNQATFKGNHTQLLDNRRCTITKPEVKQYKSEITKENISAVTSSSTFDFRYCFCLSNSDISALSISIVSSLRLSISCTQGSDK